jgi:hypothetical protein
MPDHERSTTMTQSLESKLHGFAASLTAEESAQVRGFLLELERGLPPSVRAKARQFVRDLSPEEAARLARSARDAAADLVPDADTAGHAVAAYEDEFGYKGRLGTNPIFNSGSGGESLGIAVVIGSIGALLIGGILGGGDLDEL